MTPDKSKVKKPYWETHDGWDTAGNCIKCGEAGRCECKHPKKQSSGAKSCPVCKSYLAVLDNYFKDKHINNCKRLETISITSRAEFKKFEAKGGV